MLIANDGGSNVKRSIFCHKKDERVRAGQFHKTNDNKATTSLESSCGPDSTGRTARKPAFPDMISREIAGYSTNGDFWGQ
jgi:hypothetical protein